MSDAEALPQEIITDILSRLPFKSLSRFKCVSPSWKTLISSPHFAQTRLNRTNANYHPLKAILFTRSFDLYSVDFADANPTPKELGPPSPSFNYFMSDSRLVSSCNGLVLVSYDGYKNFLGNPFTNEWNDLPFPFRLYSSMDVFYPPGLGYVASADDYKVVMPIFKRFLPPDHAAVTIVAVYSLKTNAWRTFQDFHYPSANRRRGVCLNERLHWLCWRTDDYSDVVVAFDLVDEICREVQLPASYHDNVSWGYEMEIEMVVLEGCLCLLVWSMSDRIDVWMMMDYGVKESWMNIFSIANPGGSIVDVLCLSAQDELVLRRERFTGIRGWVDSEEDEFDGEKLILCNPMQGTRREVLVPGIPTTSLVGDNYIETLRCPNS